MNKDIAPVLDEISAILKKHDMVGLVVVGNPTHCDWRVEIEASWSCARLDELPGGGHALRIRSKLADYPSKKEQKKQIEATVGTFVTFNDTIDMIKEQFGKILVMISRSVDFIGRSTRED